MVFINLFISFGAPFVKNQLINLHIITDIRKILNLVPTSPCLFSINVFSPSRGENFTKDPFTGFVTIKVFGVADELRQDVILMNS